MSCTCEIDIARPEARFDRLEPDIAELVAQTKRQRIREGWPLCASCGGLTHPHDMCWLSRKLCASCGMRLVDKLLWKIVKRHGGRKRALRLLRKLAK